MGWGGGGGGASTPYWAAQVWRLCPPRGRFLLSHLLVCSFPCIGAPLLLLAAALLLLPAATRGGGGGGAGAAPASRQAAREAREHGPAHLLHSATIFSAAKRAVS